MGEASRVLAAVARLHALQIDDVHLPFGGEAMTRFGHPLPLSTREAYRDADAILVSSPDDPAFDGVMADLDLAWRVSRVHNQPRGDLLVVEPLGTGADELAIARAFEIAAARRARLTSVGSTAEWNELVTARGRRLGRPRRRAADACATCSRASATTRARSTSSSRPGIFAGAIVDAAAHLAGSLHTVASGWLSQRGPGLFAAEVCDDNEVAGFGVADADGHAARRLAAARRGPRPALGRAHARAGRHCRRGIRRRQTHAVSPTR